MTRFPAVEAFRGRKGLIRVVGHRGARGVLPENTMLGFEFAMSTGAHLLEFDVVLTKDGVPIITHNHRLHAPTFRDANGFLSAEPKVSELTWAEIQQFDVGRIDGNSAYGQRFPDQAQIDGLHVPRLSDLLKCVSHHRNRHAHLMLELKSDPAFALDPDYRRSFVSRVLEDVRAAGLERRTLLHSFDWGLLEECRSQAPEMPRSFLTQMPENEDDVGEDSSKAVSPDFSGRENQIPDMVADAGGKLWCPYIKDITPGALARARHHGLVVCIWTVNEPQDIADMIDLGVDAIVSDYPGRVQRQLADRGLEYS